MASVTLGELFSSVFQVVFFAIIPFIWWLITARKKENFFTWLGFKKPTGSPKEILKYLLGAWVICEVVGQIVTRVFLNAEWNRSVFAGMGIQGLPGALLYSYIHTALSEEILFRGFLQKRLQAKFGFKVGTIIQAIIFGLAHIVPVFNMLTPTQALALALYPILPGVCIAFINEKKAGGSILPGWLLHGTLNILTHAMQL